MKEELEQMEIRLRNELKNEIKKLKTFFYAFIASVVFISIILSQLNRWGNIHIENQVEKCKKEQGKCVKYLPFWRVECIECEELKNNN